MGYNVYLTRSDFRIAKGKLPATFEALKELNKRNDLKTGGSYGPLPDGSYGQSEIWFAWMDANYDKTSKDAGHVFEQLGFTVEYDDDGDLRLTEYDSKSGAEDHFLAAAAPFVTPGSYLEWEGEDGEHWRHEFDGAGMAHKSGRIIFEQERPTGNTHRGVIETSAPPSLSLIASGPEDLCRGAVAAWIAEHPLGEFDTALVLRVES